MRYSRLMVTLISLSFISSFAQPVFAAVSPSTADSFCSLSVGGYTTTRLTNNAKLNTSVIPLEDGHAAWLELPEGGGSPGKVIYFDGRNQRVLSENADIDNGRGGIAAAGSNKIAWEENTGGRLDVFFFDGTSVRRLTSPDGDVTNNGVAVDASGKVAWVRTISDPVNGGSTPVQLYGESRVMLWDGVTARPISEANRSNSNNVDNSFMYRPVFSNGVLTWIAVEVTQAHANRGNDRYSVYKYDSGVVRSHVLSDLPGGHYFFNYVLTDAGIIYQASVSTSEGAYRSYRWAVDTTTDLTRFPAGSHNSFVANSDRFGWTFFSPAGKTYLWTGGELRETGLLKPASYTAHLNTDDISADGRFVLYTANTGGPSPVNQIFKYDIASNTLSQLTNTSGAGATEAVFGKNGEIYWTVFSSTSYQSTDICVARPSAGTASASNERSALQSVAQQALPDTDISCSEETVRDYVHAMGEAGQAFKSAALVSFDVQAGYRLRASINKSRIKTVRAALADARKKFERELDAILAEQRVIDETRIRTKNPRTVSLTAFDASWAAMNRTLLVYASAADKAVINRALTAKKNEIVNAYTASRAAIYTNAVVIMTSCSQ